MQLGHKWVICGSHPDCSVGSVGQMSTGVIHFHPCSMCTYLCKIEQPYSKMYTLNSISRLVPIYYVHFSYPSQLLTYSYTNRAVFILPLCHKSTVQRSYLQNKLQLIYHLKTELQMFMNSAQHTVSTQVCIMSVCILKFMKLAQDARNLSYQLCYA